MTLTAAQIADKMLEKPEGAREYRPHEALVEISTALRSGDKSPKECAIRAWTMNDRLEGKADEMTRARLRCTYKRIYRHLLVDQAAA